MADLSIGVPIVPGLDNSGILQCATAIDLDVYPSGVSATEQADLLQPLASILSDQINSHAKTNVHHGGRGALSDALAVLKHVHGVKNVSTASPYWFGFEQIVTRAGLNFTPRSLAGSDTHSDVLICCTPNNPDGSCEFSWLVETGQHYDHIILDLVYLDFLSDLQKTQLKQLIEQLHHKLILVFSTSKSCAAPGLRVGYTLTFDPEMAHHIASFQASYCNKVSGLPRQIARQFWTDQSRREKITSHYQSIRDQIPLCLREGGTRHHAHGMFLWVTTSRMTGKVILEKVEEKLNHRGSDGALFGDEAATRWSLENGVDYSEIIQLINQIDGA